MPGKTASDNNVHLSAVLAAYFEYNCLFACLPLFPTPAFESFLETVFPGFYTALLCLPSPTPFVLPC